MSQLTAMPLNLLRKSTSHLGQDVMLAKAVLLLAATVAVILLSQPGAEFSSQGYDVCHDIGISLLQGRRANVCHPPFPLPGLALAHPDPHDYSDASSRRTARTLA